MSRAGLAVALAAMALVGVSPVTERPARLGTAEWPNQERVVVLTIHHSHFSTDTVRVAPGTNVRFVVRNEDPIGHELIIGNAMVQLRHERGTEAHHAPRPGEVSVAPDSVAETTYAFGAPGRLLFGCHLPGHWAYGMHGAIEVA